MRGGREEAWVGRGAVCQGGEWGPVRACPRPSALCVRVALRPRLTGRTCAEGARREAKGESQGREVKVRTSGKELRGPRSLA